MPDEFFTVSELNRFIKDVIASGFPQPLWICGEIQQYDRNKHKDHIFFELVEKDPNSKDIIARIGLVIFAKRKAFIDQILKQNENGFALKDDIEVKFLCKIDFYAPHGALRLIVESIDPTYTLGRLAQAKQKLIALLKEKGTFEKNKQLSLPLVPLNIGLITAFDSAAYNDFVSELQKSGLAFQIFLRDTLVQGKKAEKDIVSALKELQKIQTLDVIVITRGGGSLADLSCFDSALIAEAIAGYSLPVLSGIGHEINLSITDMAAHTYAKTPTAIAQVLVNYVQQFLGSLDDLQEKLLELVSGRIQDQKKNLKTLALSLQNGLFKFLKDHNEAIISFKETIKYRSEILLKDSQKALNYHQDSLKKGARLRLEKDGLKLSNYQKMIDMAHPVNTLKRGFSITRIKGGKALRSVKDVGAYQELVTEFADGSVESQVKGKLNKEIQETFF